MSTTTTHVRLLDLLEAEVEVDDAQADLERYRVAYPGDHAGIEPFEVAVRNAERRLTALRSAYWEGRP